jgi:3-methylfumaryl-CoA hydratase
MFAGGEVVIHRDIEVGQQVEREAVVENVEEKHGRTGRLAIVKVRTLLRSLGGDLLLNESQDIVYREGDASDGRPRPEPGPAAAMRPSGPPLQHAGTGWEFTTDPTLLMRFSAATANAHRIHYDWPYATRVEGYPGLVVHGPLSTLVLAETLRLARPGHRVHRLRHRNTAPLFCGDAARVTHTPTEADSPDAIEAVLSNSTGTPVATIVAEFGR